MAEFEVNVVRIDDVVEHPDADRLTIVKIGGYNCIANKKEDGSWRYQKDDLVVYIPEQALVPEWLLKKMGFWDEEKGKGGLAGSRGDRVKAIKLRGIFSQGILMPVIIETEDDYHFVTVQGSDQRYIIAEGKNAFEEAIGVDVSDLLGVTKYEPPIPASMSGKVWNASGKTLKYDIENIQRYPNVFKEDECVSVTEKLHGTWCCYGFYPNEDSSAVKVVSSKGLSARGLAFEMDEENMTKNLYLQVLERSRDEQGFDLLERLINLSDRAEPIYLLGEVFGRGVQDLVYGTSMPEFRLFDVYVGKPGQGRYLDPIDLHFLANSLKIETVPILYSGPFSMEKMTEIRDGKDFSGSNIREGIVIRPKEERQDDTIGRVQLKFVSPKYLLRKGGTELA